MSLSAVPAGKPLPVSKPYRLVELADNTMPRTVELLQRAAARICNYAGARAEEAGSDD